MSVHAATPQKLHQNTPPIVVGPLQDAYGNPKGPAKQQPMLSADAVESNEYSLSSDFIPPHCVL